MSVGREGGDEGDQPVVAARTQVADRVAQWVQVGEPHSVPCMSLDVGIVGVTAHVLRDDASIRPELGSQPDARAPSSEARGQARDHAGLLDLVELPELDLDFELVGDRRAASVVREILGGEPRASPRACLWLQDCPHRIDDVALPEVVLAHEDRERVAERVLTLEVAVAGGDELVDVHERVATRPGYHQWSVVVARFRLSPIRLDAGLGPLRRRYVVRRPCQSSMMLCLQQAPSSPVRCCGRKLTSQ